MKKILITLYLIVCTLSVSSQKNDRTSLPMTLKLKLEKIDKYVRSIDSKKLFIVEERHGEYTNGQTFADYQCYLDSLDKKVVKRISETYGIPHRRTYVTYYKNNLKIYSKNTANKLGKDSLIKEEYYENNKVIHTVPNIAARPH
ncbi:MAG: hypothetical protein V4553_04290 [Bacteroidota bacterium]